MRWLMVPSLLAAVAMAPGECPEFAQAEVVGEVTATGLDELSGLAASRLNPGIYWTHNDKGGQNAVFAIEETGEWRGTWILQGIAANDLEDIAIGPGPGDELYVYVGDTGNNNLNREFHSIHRFAEREVSRSGPPTTTVMTDFETLFYRYPDDLRYDAETLLVDPITGDLMLVTRDRQGTGFSTAWLIDADQPWDGSIIEPVLVASIFLPGGLQIKGGEVSPDGQFVALVHHRNSNGSTEIRLYQRVEGENFAFSPGACRVIPHPNTPQTEAVAWRPDGMALVTTSEGIQQPIYALDRFPPIPSVRINEVMAANSSTIADNTGAFAAWVEICNVGMEETDLGGLYLSDDFANRTKWQFPADTILPAGGFLVVWASGAPARTAPGYLHTNFTLSPNGDVVGIFESSEWENRTVDNLIFGPQQPDVSFGRIPDGTGSFQLLENPSPGISNQSLPTSLWVTY
ncbi:MAG: lamin tail domain-containing protein [Candidatus Sumerlaeia bacterium]|nr:lamin tail domain-containing protein [Candidatus Sumerlaeia bacterium]